MLMVMSMLHIVAVDAAGLPSAGPTRIVD